ncbi:CHAD domain-containing protein [uncultured Paracoccus sp.]|uniref:CYTH and CHAD domain-containing protein n=1 Tax=uncultured Paracoccus sp. TaxID=189685 RepID=UPI0025F1D465|nr:CHAD domain-containing protein [uncultured Paracoccus sp.]
MEEIELKLDLSDAAAGALAASDLLAGPAEAIDQTAVYFDTPDHALAAAGTSLRIRQSKGSRIQTVKQGNGAAAGLFARTEWEKPVDGDLPDLDDTPIPALLGADAHDIAPVFTVNVTRRTWMLDDAGARIELVIDRGTVHAADRFTPVSECELELKSGPPAALFALARRLNAIAPVKLGVLSKSDRGYRLSGAAVMSHKAGPVALDDGMDAAQAFQAIVHSCIRQFRLNEDLILAIRAPEALHQARVALRRLRSAFSIHRPMLGQDGAALRADLRWLAGEMGQARDLDVLLERAIRGPYADRIRRERESAYDHVQQVLNSARARGLMLDLVDWLNGGDWLNDPQFYTLRGMPAREFASLALSRYRRKVKKAGRGLTTMEDEARHDLRKDAKKLRYASDFFTPLFSGGVRHKRFGKALADLQDQLGALNDLSAAPDILDRLGIQAGPDRDSLVPAGHKARSLKAAQGAYWKLAEAKRFWDKAGT